MTHAIVTSSHERQTRHLLWLSLLGLLAVLTFAAVQFSAWASRDPTAPLPAGPAPATSPAPAPTSTTPQTSAAPALPELRPPARTGVLPTSPPPAAVAPVDPVQDDAELAEYAAAAGMTARSHPRNGGRP